MRNKGWKSIVSYVLALLMILTAIPNTALQVNATEKMTLSASQIILTKGMTQTVKPKHIKAGSIIKWSSKDKSIATVTSKGAVKGIKDGKTVIQCVVTFAGKKTSLKCSVTVKTPKFYKSAYTISKGESVSLALKNKYSKSSYKWSSGDKNIAKVNSKGKVKGIGVGETTVAVKISIPKTRNHSAKVITKKVAIVVENSTSGNNVSVATQEELTKALSDKIAKKITVQTDEKVALTIPKGNYKTVKLVVDAPKADIINNGVFKNITIKQIAADTWTEKANGNVLILDAAAGHVVIPRTAGISEIRIINANSNFKLDVQGNVDKISIDSPAKIEIKIMGTVGTVDVNSRAIVSVEGSSTDSIAIKVAEGADGTTLSSNVKVDVGTGSDTEINLSKGAEGSVVKTTNEKKFVEVTNNTVSIVQVTNKTGKNQTIEVGKNAIVDGNGIIINSTTVNGGGSSSDGSYPDSGASSSGNLTRIISYFDMLPTVIAGTSGETLKTVEQIKGMLPTEVTANDTKGGKITFTVTDWINENGYSKDSAAGNYIFSAVLGSASAICINPDNRKAVVSVCVACSWDVKYGDISNIEVTRYNCFNYNELDDYAVCFKLTNRGIKSISFHGEVQFYDVNNYLINTAGIMNRYGNSELSSGRYYLKPGETQFFVVDRFHSPKKFDKYVIDLSDARVADLETENVLSEIVNEVTETATGINVKVTNTSKKQIDSVYVTAVLFDESGNIISIKGQECDEIYAPGYSQTVTINTKQVEFSDENYDMRYVAAASYQVFLTGAEVRKEQEILVNDNIPENIEVTRYNCFNYNELDDYAVCFKLTNRGTKSISFHGEVQFYDVNNYLISTAGIMNRYGKSELSSGRYYLKPGETQFFVVDRGLSPKKFDKYVIDLSDARVADLETENVLSEIVNKVTETATGINVKVTNTSTKQIDSVYVTAVLFDESGNIISIKGQECDEIYAPGYSQTVTINTKQVEFSDENGDMRYVAAASYQVFLTGAEVRKEQEILVNDNIPENIEVTRYNCFNYNELDDYAVCFKLTNRGTKSISFHGEVQFYDANNYLISTAGIMNRYGKSYYLKPGETQFFVVERGLSPKKFNKYVIDLSNVKVADLETENVLSEIVNEVTETATGINVKVTNTSTKQIDSVYVTAVLFDEFGNIISIKGQECDEIYAPGYSQTVTINTKQVEFSDENYDMRYVAAASYQVFLTGAEVRE